jgi:hypothetical protein
MKTAYSPSCNGTHKAMLLHSCFGTVHDNTKQMASTSQVKTLQKSTIKDGDNPKFA